MGRAVEGRGDRGVGLRECNHRGTPVIGAFAEQADRGIDEFAHRAAVLRPGIAAQTQAVGDHAVGGWPVVACGGYDLIKDLEERSSGFYSPSPGVIYPTLTFLEEAGHATSSAEGNKKVYAISDAGRAHLTENKESADAILARIAWVGKRLAQARQWFERGDGDHEHDGRDRDMADVAPDLNDARRELKRALARKRGSSRRRAASTAATG